MNTTTRPQAAASAFLRERDLESLRFGYSAARYAVSLLQAIANPVPNPPISIESRLDGLSEMQCRMDENSGLRLHIVNAARGGRPYRHDGQEHDSVIVAIHTGIRKVLLASAHGSDVVTSARAWADSQVIRNVQRELDIELALTEGFPAEVPVGEPPDAPRSSEKSGYTPTRHDHKRGRKPKVSNVPVYGILYARFGSRHTPGEIIEAIGREKKLQQSLKAAGLSMTSTEALAKVLDSYRGWSEREDKRIAPAHAA